MHRIKTVLIAMLMLPLTACVTQPTVKVASGASEYNLTLLGFQQSQRQQIQDKIGLDQLRVIECSTNNCEYWYSGTMTSGKLYQTLQRVLSKQQLNIPSNITLQQGNIRIVKIASRRNTTAPKTTPKPSSSKGSWVNRW